MQEEQEYTDVYTFKEKLPFIGITLLGVLLFVAIYKLWLFPMQNEYLDNFHCRSDIVFQANLAIHIFFMIFILMFTYNLYHGYKIIKYKRFPLSDKSDFKRKILRGEKAVNRGRLLIAISFIFIIVFVYLDIRINDEIISRIDINKINKSGCQNIMQ